MGRPVTEKTLEALDYLYMRTALQAVIQDRCGTAVAVHGMTIEPDGRSLIHYRVETYETGTPRQPPWRIIGKVYATSAAGQRSFDAMRQLWDGGFAQQAPAQVRIPEPYTYLADLRLLLMEAVPGRSLKTLLKKKLASPEHMRLLAAAMAKVDRLMEEVDAKIGLDRLRLLHVNDARDGLGSNRDHHANIGEGVLGDKLAAMLGHPAVRDLPAVLEVPGPDDHGPDAAEVAKLKALYKKAAARRRARTRP